MYYLAVFLPLDVTLVYYQDFDSPDQANAWRRGKPEYVSFEVVSGAYLAGIDDVIKIPLKYKTT